MATALITHNDATLHEISPGHPECPQRIGAVLDQLKKENLYDYLVHMDAPVAPHSAPVGAHSERYVQSVIDSAPASGYVQLDADTAMNPHTLTAALRAVGAGMLATDKVMSGEVENAFCLVRPPGHHAETATAMGFCFFGSIAIAAKHALDFHALERVAIVDFDVHHGNGTEDIVEGDDRILFCSTFQHPLYPGSYRPSITGQRINVPLDAGTGSVEFREQVSTHWLPALNAFKPQLLFISAGFDAHVEDPLAGLALVDSDYAWITGELVKVAAEHSQGRIVSMLEGGYALPALARSASVHVRGLMKL